MAFSRHVRFDMPTLPATASAAVPLLLRGVSHGYGDRLLLDSVDLSIPPGEHVVVIGENGAGKSTLLRLLAGQELPEAGQVQPATAAGYLAQQHRWPEGSTVQTALDAALSEVRAMEAELHVLEAQLAAADPETVDRYDELATRFALRGGYRAEALLDAAMDRLGLGRIVRDRKVSSLSGGEAERLALACLLADPAPVLLLDEPTNHLDAAGLDWLEGRLAGHRGTVVVVSHDRVLLRRIAQTVLEVDADRAELRRYGNGYTGYLSEKRAERARWEQAYQHWLSSIARERQKAAGAEGRVAYGRIKDKNKMAFDRHTGLVEAAVSSQIRNARERLRRLEAKPIDRPPEPLRLAAQLGAPSTAGAVLEARGLRVPGRLDRLDLSVAADAKLLVTGPNGAGKSTLLHALAGAGQVAVQGEVRRRGNIGYLPQDLPLPERPNQRLLPAYAAGRVGDIDEHAELLLRLGLFRSADFALPVGTLSAGQYRRLALARLLSAGHDVLLLDEPTNHFAPQLVDELQELFGQFAGALLAVSHDRDFRRWFGSLPGSRELAMSQGRVAESRAAQSEHRIEDQQGEQVLGQMQ